jgi:hypothetical protein
MSRAIRAYRRKDGGITATFDLIAVSRKLEAGTLTARERGIYRRVFGQEPEELRKQPPTVGGVGGNGRTEDTASTQSTTGASQLAQDPQVQQHEGAD